MKDLQSLALRFINGRLSLLDQRQLPLKEEWLEVESPEVMVHAIKTLQVRGAPLIGVAASLSLAQLLMMGATETEFREWAQKLRESRPTAVNLMNALDALLSYEVFDRETIIHKAIQIFDEDVELCQRMAALGEELIQEGEAILTHCNTGGLATAGIGTALGILRLASEQGKQIHVYVDETRPLLQGGRLTSWELQKLGIPYTLICDNMAAALMAQDRIQRCIVGADRIAMNGDFANKVGTYGVAVLSAYHKIPFYVAAPVTTLDFACESGQDIPIEQRMSEEVCGVRGAFGEVRWAPQEAEVYNPAFDVTPANLVQGWILDSGVYSREDVGSGALRHVLQ